jgi:radical SAM-linked protein
VKRYRVAFSKTGSLRYLSHLELVRAFIRALKRARIPLVYSGGYHPLPRITFAAALPVGTKSLHETVDIQVHGVESAAALKEKLANRLPEGIHLLSLEEWPLGAASPKLKESTYEIDLDGIGFRSADLDTFLLAESFPVVKKGKKGEKTVDLRTLVKSVDILGSGKVCLVIRHPGGAELKPAEMMKSIFSIPEDKILKVVKTDEVVD